MASEPAGVALEGIGFSYDTGPRVLKDVTFRTRPGEVLSLLGPSGCGKTTLLRIIAGLQRPATGSVRVGDRVLTDASSGVEVAPRKRGVALVFQNWALFPHMDVAANITFGMPKAVRADGALLAQTLAMVGLEGLESRLPGELSGGQQQRVALGRAVAQRPEVILLDEPFSNLDPSLRSRVRVEVRELLGSLGTTTVLVTHDREEAMLLGDRLVLLRAGRVVASGDPVDLYRRPPDRWSAGFLGDVVLLHGDASDGFVQTVLGPLKCADDSQGPVDVMLRPEQITLGPHTTSHGHAGDGGCAVGTVVAVEFHGPLTRYSVSVSGVDLGAVATGVPVSKVGDEVTVRGPHEAVITWPSAQGTV